MNWVYSQFSFRDIAQQLLHCSRFIQTGRRKMTQDNFVVSDSGVDVMRYQQLQEMTTGNQTARFLIG